MMNAQLKEILSKPDKYFANGRALDALPYLMDAARRYF